MKIWSESELYTTTIFALNSQIIAYKTRCFTKKKEKIFIWYFFLRYLLSEFDTQAEAGLKSPAESDIHLNQVVAIQCPPETHKASTMENFNCQTRTTATTS